MLTSIFWGFIFGTFNGLLARISLKAVINKSDKIFFSVWIAGFIYRLLFLICAVLFLKNKNYIILIPFVLTLIISQFIFEIIPIKKKDRI
jgi:hypothetical protein